MTTERSEDGREGSYPAPPRWPEKLCTIERAISRHPLCPLIETEAIQHDYVADGYPGPCSISFRNGVFVGWMPALTVDRAEEYARRA